jgi:catechol 2,3-dioxygenase-like lactoylglutathione lyase family enzyme
MQLGTIAHLTISVPVIAPSLEFYKLLGFRVIAKSSEPYTWATLTDGIIVINLNQDQERYFGITYFSPNVDERVRFFEGKGVTFAHKEFNTKGKVSQAIIWGMNQVGIGLVERDPATVFVPSGSSIALCGRFGELSLQTTNLFISIQTWMQLGFRIVLQEPTGVLMTDDLLLIGIHQTQNWNIPSLIYFTEPSGEEIRSLVDLGLPANLYNDSATGQFNMATAVAPDGLPFFFLKKV